MDEGRVFHDREACRDPDAVVGAQGRSLGLDPVSLDLGLDGVLGEVVGDIGVLFPDHVQVALEHDAGRALMAGAGRLHDQHVPDLVLAGLELQAPGEGYDVIAEGLLVPRAMGDGQDLGEVFPDMGGLEFCQSGRHEVPPSVRVREPE